MDLKGIGLFQMISQQLRWLGQRQQVLSQNVANANTPGYQARDLQPVSFGDALQQATLQPAVTQAGHLPGKAADPGAAKVKTITPWEVSPDGNGVVLEQQMTQLAETQADYQMATELYRKQIGMLKTAIGSNKAS
jgi:flagellar basal-body rod protein FlgB